MFAPCAPQNGTGKKGFTPPRAPNFNPPVGLGGAPGKNRGCLPPSPPFGLRGPPGAMFGDPLRPRMPSGSGVRGQDFGPTGVRGGWGKGLQDLGHVLNPQLGGRPSPRYPPSAPPVAFCVMAGGRSEALGLGRWERGSIPRGVVGPPVRLEKTGGKGAGKPPPSPPKGGVPGPPGGAPSLGGKKAPKRGNKTWETPFPPGGHYKPSGFKPTLIKFFLLSQSVFSYLLFVGFSFPG